ncbi:MAG: DUF2914 domain-containing protein [bacterium]
MKKKIILISLFICFGICLSGKIMAQENINQSMSIPEINFCLSIENKQPISIAKTFKNDVGKIYCWTLFEKVKEDMEIEHIWYYQNKIVTKIKLTVKSPKYRTWSMKNIAKSQKGNWKVVIVDKMGNVLGSNSFVVE